MELVTAFRETSAKGNAVCLKFEENGKIFSIYQRRERGMLQTVDLSFL